MGDGEYINEAWKYQDRKLKDIDENDIIAHAHKIYGLSICMGNEKHCEEFVQDTLYSLPPHFYEAEIEEAFWYFGKFYITLRAA